MKGQGNINSFWGIATAFTLLFLATPFIAAIVYWFPSWDAAIYLKDALVVLLSIGLTAINYKRLLTPNLHFAVIPLLFFLLVMVVMGGAELKPIAAALRQILYPFLFLTLGLIVKTPAVLVEKLARYFVNISIALVGVGFVMILIGQANYQWIRPYFLAKGLMLEMTGFPSQWVEPIYGGIPRMASTFFDPVNFGHFLVFVLALAWLQKRKAWILGFLMLGLIFTICKGAWMHLGLMAIFLLPRIPKPLRWAGFLMVPILLLVAANFHPGVALHIKGVKTAIVTSKAFGYGLAETGNVAIIFGNPTGPNIHDTYIGAILGQIGWVGLLLWLLPLFLFLLQLKKENFTLSLLIGMQVFVGLYSENAMNLLSVAPAFIFGGLYLANSKKRPSGLSIIDHVGTKAGMDYFTSNLSKAFLGGDFRVEVYSNFKETSSVKFHRVFTGKRKNLVDKTTDFIFGHLCTYGKLLLGTNRHVVIHSFETGIKEFIAQLFFKILGFQITLIVHDVEGFSSSDSMFLKRIMYGTLCHKIAVLNKSSKGVLLKHFPHLIGKVYQIKHGHFIALSEGGNQKQVVSNNEIPSILFFGQIKPVKGLDILLEAMPDVAEAKLIIAGRPWQDDFNKYQAIIEKLNLTDRVEKHLRFISDAERHQLFLEADVIVIPYRKIFQSGVLIMAMSYGKAVVASDLDSNEEIISNHKNGVLFKSEDSKSLADALNQVLQDSDKLEALGVEAKQRMRSSFSWEKQADQILKNWPE